MLNIHRNYYAKSHKMIDITDDGCASQYAVLQDLFASKISLQNATDKLASVSLSDDCLSLTWNLIITHACKFPEHQDRLIDVLVHLSKLPDALTGKDEPLKKYDMQIWRDLPMLCWDFRDEWNLQPIPSPPPNDRQEAILSYVNLNKFTALLMATEEPVFNYSWFALITLRTALETPPNELPETDPLDAYVQAAAVWMETIGIEIYEWDEEYEHGPLVGAPGRGGPLWKGKHGFCEQRWQFWRERFGELASLDDKLGEEAKTAAREAELIMRDIENGNVVE